MKTITLKLTKPEYNTIGYYDVVVEGNTKGFKSVPTHIRGESEQRVSEKEKQLKNGIFEIEILDVDKFREFLNDEIKDVNGSWKRITIVDYNNLKSILSKLDKAVDKPEEGKIYALTGGVGDKCIANGDSWKDSVVQNDEPKSFKTEEELVKHFRSIGDKDYNDASDEYILDEAWHNGEWGMSEGVYILIPALKVVQNDEPKDETLKKLTDIVNWVNGKYDGDELREHMIVKTIKKDLLS